MRALISHSILALRYAMTSSSAWVGGGRRCRLGAGAAFDANVGQQLDIAIRLLFSLPEGGADSVDIGSPIR
jgi:hypothetical protein